MSSMNLIRHSSVSLVMAALAAVCGCSGQPAPETFANVDDMRLAASEEDPDNWLSYGHGYSEQRFSGLTQINDQNIQQLAPAWAVELDTARGQEATPIVVDGVMFTSTALSKVMALDAATGNVLWRYDPEVDGRQISHACCDFVNRGVAVWKGKVYVGALDGRLIALDANNGRKLWETLTVDRDKPYTITMAPRVVRGRVIIGNSGAELGVRGYVSAYDADSGQLSWRFYTVPGDPAAGPDGAASDEILEKLARPTWYGENYWKLGGGGTVWDSVVYDQELDQLLIGVGNGSPWSHRWRSEGRGDNLFLASILSLDPDTGRYKWHYQVNPGETWDYTATQQITLADLTIDGKPRKVAMQAPKNGFFYVIDRTNGKLISAEPFVRQNWAVRIDLVTGRPVENPGMRFDTAPARLMPSGIGGHSWMPMSFSPRTGLVYLPAMETSALLSQAEPFEIRPGRWNTAVSFMGPPPSQSAPPAVPAPRSRGLLLAWDPVKQQARWSIERDWTWHGGTLTTAGNLVFQGTGYGDFEAYSADEGRKLWSHPTHRGIMAGPVTYRVGGEQYVAVMAGHGGASGVAGSPPFLKDRAPNGLIVAFKLGGKTELPMPVPAPLATPRPSTEDFSPAQIAAGAGLYFGACVICHGGVVNPNLQRSPLTASREAFHQVVLGGALTHKGMTSFAPTLSVDQVESIRAFLNQQAREMLAAEQSH